MNGDSWNVVRAEGGFIVHVNRVADQPSEGAATISGTYEPRVFTDSAALLNFLHNEFVGE